MYRGDAHFSSPEISKWIDTQENLHSVTGLTGNSVLNKNVETTLARARKLHQERKANKMKNTKAKLYHSFYYKAKSWHKPQRVIAKVEYSEKGKNIRFILTTMTKCKTQQLYEEIYCARGKMELYIKEHKRYLKSDRTSCHKFEANQFRLFLHSAAYSFLSGPRTSGVADCATGVGGW